MSQCDGTASDIYPLFIHFCLSNDRQRLSSKGFVQLDKFDVVYAEVMSSQTFCCGGDRANSHDAGINTGGGGTSIDAQNLMTVGDGTVFSHENKGGCAVIQATAIAGGDTAALAEDSSQSTQFLQGAVNPRTLIGIENNRVGFTSGH